MTGGQQGAESAAEANAKEDGDKKWRLLYGGRYCSVVNCHNNSYKHGPQGIKFHSFPANPERRLQWTKAVRRAVPGKPGALWQPKKHDVVCSEHFVGGKKSNDKNSVSFVPSIFPTHQLPEKSEQSIARSHRREARISTQAQQGRKKKDDERPSAAAASASAASATATASAASAATNPDSNNNSLFDSDEGSVDGNKGKFEGEEEEEEDQDEDELPDPQPQPIQGTSYFNFVHLNCW